MPEEYEDWVDAQIFSEKASKMYANFKDTIYPLEKTKFAYVLENMWKFVNLVSCARLQRSSSFAMSDESRR